MPSSIDQNAPLGSIADELCRKAESGGMQTHEMMDTVGHAAYGPLLLLIGLVTVTPLGSIPGASIATGIVLFSLGWHMFFGRGGVALPDWIGRRRVEGGKVKETLSKVRPALDRVDRLPRPRLQRFVRPPWTRVTAIGVIIAGALMFPLAFVPWGVMAPGIPLVVLGLGLTGKDGLLTAIGLSALAVAFLLSAYLLVTFLPGV